ncbi:1-acyl-sn-glycerol-3-phosphate acyltransferase [Synechococcus sp. CS-1328]|uniref:1-acyl-sn-glycerol-3-phosphate acyltransferase n=1 Tax=Synechococcus sp. CS-1328 TaxID=2847976 RepID=UPI00223AF19E|nr:1-acyl-sn-glycerol-3-phosphate acyltransferase [Synechococcus sp. CS-1328]MCT0225227.1 1-acyl-sn-glycerol-3-phosphate acyltransferase [Synechococcus sp. CS-1328]
MPERTGQGLEPIPPRLNLAMVRLLHGLLPLLLRFRWFVWLPARIKALELVEGERLMEAFQRFQAGELRLILAFRHGEVDDPLSALWLLSRGLPALAHRSGVHLRLPLHAQFLYDRGMPLWGGRGLGWVLSRLGGVSLRRGRRPDWTALRTSRHLVLDGTCPFAVAPEGATNGHGEQLGPLENGVAQLGVWCVQDLDRAGRSEAVWIVPISLQYRYCRQNWGALENLLARLELLVGLATDRAGTRPKDEAPDNAAIQNQAVSTDHAVSTNHSASTDKALRLYPRLLAIGDVLLEQLERFYERLIPQPSPGTPATAAQGSTADSPGRGERIRALLDRALALAENRLGLSGGGTPEERCRRLEEEGWRRQFREDLPLRRHLSPLDRALADWLARDAAMALRHMRLAEGLVAVSGDYVASRPSFERFAETALLLHDALQRLQGVRLPRRPGLGARQVRLTVADPIRLRPQGKPLPAAAPVGPGNGGRQRQRTAAITARIQAAFEQALI